MTLNPAQVAAHKIAEEIGLSFVQQYYSTFQENRANLLAIYHPEAWFQYENKTAVGRDQIKQILEGLSFTSINFQITKADVQPTMDDGILIFVTGMLKTDDDHPHSFAQTFILKNVNGNFFLCHDIFRLAIHDSG